MADIQIQGVDALFAKLGKLEAQNLLVPPMDESLYALEAYMEVYPPPLAPVAGTAFSPVRFTTKGGKAVSFTALSAGWKRRGRKVVYVGYKRTGKLGQRWANGKRIKRTANGLEGSLTNNLSYAPYVQSAAKQAWMHQGRWRTDQMAIDKLRPFIMARFQAAIDAALK